MVPGINTPFARPVKLSAGLYHYMGRDSVFIAYCWPASGKLFAYARDSETVGLTIRNLRELLFMLSQETQARRIHVIGYSRGAAILSGALLEMRLMHADDDVQTMRAARKIGTVVYAGPDEDLMIFKSLFLDQVEDLVEVMLIYASPRNTALKLSRMFGGKTERLGRPETGLTQEDYDALRQEMLSAWINVEYAQKQAGAGKVGHTFWYDNPWVSSDLIAALKYSLAPADRGLTRAKDAAMWTFPRDYPQRIREILAAQQSP